MTEKEPTKVYELAKELGIDSISLVDKLKTLEINVKNHMSELTDTDVERARTALKAAVRSSGSAAGATKAKTTRTTKAASTGAGATAAATGTKKVVARRASGTTATAAAAETTETAKAEPAAKPVRKRASPTSKEKEAAGESGTSSSTVIRRRALSDGAIQTVTSTISTSTESATAAPAVEPAYETAPTPETSVEEAPSAKAVAPAAAESPSEGTVSTVRTETKTEGGKTTTSIIRRVETTTLTTSSLKDSMGKRTGLRILEQPKPTPKVAPKPVAKAGAAAPEEGKKGGFKSDRDGFKFARVDKENLDRMAEEEARKRGPKAFESEIKPEDIKFSDYRKKEMIFIPKKKKAPVGKATAKTEITVAAAHKRVVEMGDSITVGELALQLHAKANEVIKKLMMMGQMATVNQAIDFDTATLVANEFQYEVKNVAFKEESILEQEQDKPEELEPRPPVVTIMGHVDHGKTTLLDSIREANVAAGEAGGITQHIGAYTITTQGKMITFIDTPGHEAFTQMRARGANVTDIVILVVSADDGVMPQTREALSHAKAAEVPIIVAVNKIDKPGANPDKIKQALAELDLLAEDWGGQTMFVPVSALKKTNIDKLLESILLVAEVEDLKANKKTLARGVVLEARVEKGRGPVASVLVNRGTLHQGDIVVSGTTWGRVKAMTNHLGQQVKSVEPGMAAEILGLDGVPVASEGFDAVEDEKAATTLVEHRIAAAREKQAKSSKASLEDLFARAAAGEVKELRVILKADVFGSVEAVKESLIKQSTDKVKVKVILAATGGITESDVMLANASDAIIVGFNVRPETKARQIAESEKIEIKSYNIIYELLDDVKNAMAGLLEKKKVETYLGRAEVRQTFSLPKAGTIAGCFIVDGKVVRNANVRLLRDSRIIYDGKLSSLKRFKDDAREVAQGYECGMGIEGYNDIKVGDLIEAYQVDMIAQEL